MADIRFHESRVSPPPIDREILMVWLEPTYIFASGQWRSGQLGEPQQDVIAWRCDCCGRFRGAPDLWAERPAPSRLLREGGGT